MNLFGKKARVSSGLANRRRWIELMDGLAAPVLCAAQRGELCRIFPETESRLAAGAGVLCGLAPFLSSRPEPGEAPCGERMCAAARSLLFDITAPDGADSCRVTTPGAEDAVGRSNGLLAFSLLWGKQRLLCVDDGKKLLDYFEQARRLHIYPDVEGLLSRALMELVIHELGGTCDTQLIDYVMTFLMRQNRGNGVFAPEDGYRWGYAHTFFLYPAASLLADELHRWFGRKGEEWRREMRRALERMSVIQARFLAPDGSFPVLGPEVWLRSGAFHTLAYAASRDQLPKSLSSSAVRQALLNLSERTLTPDGTVDEKGFLRPGLCGYQPGLCGSNFARGRLYGCMAVFAPLGLPAYHDFWQNGTGKSPWNQMWSGENVPLDCDHH